MAVTSHLRCALRTLVASVVLSLAFGSGASSATTRDPVLLVVTPGFSVRAFLPLREALRRDGEDVRLVSFDCAGQDTAGLVGELSDEARHIGHVRAVVAHGLGATLVAMAAPRLDVERLVFLAPVLDVEPVALTSSLAKEIPGFSVDLSRDLEWNGRSATAALLGTEEVPLSCAPGAFVNDVLSWIRDDRLPLDLEAIPMPVWLAVSAGDEVASVETVIPASRRIPERELVRLGLNRVDPRDFSHGEMLLDDIPVYEAARAVAAPRIRDNHPPAPPALGLAEKQPLPPPSTDASVVSLGFGEELHRVETADGFEITLSRYPREGAPPVVLCHGISSNHWFWDLEPGRSLARTLHDQGYDVWNLDLRGHGFAERNGRGHRQPVGWSVDDYGLYDLPAAFSYVKAQTGASRLYYVGHSLGGMVLAVYLTRYGEDPLASAVIVGSPMDFLDPDRISSFLLHGSGVASLFSTLPSPAGGRLLGALDVRAPLRANEYFYNPANVAEEARRLMMERVISPLSRGEIGQMGEMSHDGVFRSADGAIDYRASLASVELPMLFIAGRLDRVANADRVWSYYNAVGSKEKEFVIASVANGFHGDYGHLDFGVGDFADDDVFSRMEEWFRNHP